jgi:signal peptidase I
LDQARETPLEGLASACGLFVIILFAFTFVFQNFVIPSGSMEQTLLVGDHVMVDRETFAPPAHWAFFEHYREIRRGDLIVFIKPHEPNLTLVKRVIGLPGDHIHMRSGIVYINGVAQNEPQATKPTGNGDYDPFRDDFPSLPAQEAAGATAVWSVDMPGYKQGDDLVVPQGQYFAMGDNRLRSLDSRYWGFVPRENILGHPLFVYWSFVTPADQEYKTDMRDRLAWWMHTTLHFFDQTRWKRTLHLVS